MPRLVLDIDGVICNFVQGMLEYIEEHTDHEQKFCCWKDLDRYHFFPDDVWKRIQSDDYFWLNLRRMPGVRLKMVTNGVFPDMYLTSRPIASAVTAEWLDRNCFPKAKVVTVAKPSDKIAHLWAGDVFVDDMPETVRLAQDAGVTALLMDAPFHRGCIESNLTGLARIKCLSEVTQFIR